MPSKFRQQELKYYCLMWKTHGKTEKDDYDDYKTYVYSPSQFTDEDMYSRIAFDVIDMCKNERCIIIHGDCLSDGKPDFSKYEVIGKPVAQKRAGGTEIVLSWSGPYAGT